MTYRVLTGCRSCDAPLRIVLDLGETPIANNLCATQELALDAPRFPLALCHCIARDCGLYQLSIAIDSKTLYGEYTYATPDNPELDAHYDRVVEWLDSWIGFDEATGTCMEIGSNNGVFLEALPKWVKLGVDPSPVLHRDPTIPRIIEPFDTEIAGRIRCEIFPSVDLIVARHCLAHVDDVHEILRGVRALLQPEHGLLYVENAYWIDSMLGGQFDQIYHEHMSYLTIEAVQFLLREHGMRLIDVNFSDVHGGSFMLLAAHERSIQKPTVDVPVAIRAERAWLAQGLEERFLTATKREISATFCEVMEEFSQGHVVDAYGASAKAVTHLSAAKVTHEHVRQCIDDSPLKQGKFLPGSGIPIVSREEASAQAYPQAWHPDAVMLTAWNYERSFRERERAYLKAGGRFI